MFLLFYVSSKQPHPPASIPSFTNAHERPVCIYGGGHLLVSICLQASIQEPARKEPASPHPPLGPWEHPTASICWSASGGKHLEPSRASTARSALPGQHCQASKLEQRRAAIPGASTHAAWTTNPSLLCSQAGAHQALEAESCWNVDF